MSVDTVTSLRAGRPRNLGSFTVREKRFLSYPQPEERNSDPSQSRVQWLQRVLYNVVKWLRYEAGFTPATDKKVKFTLEQAMKTERWSRI